MKYFVEYNGSYTGTFKSIKRALNFIARKGYTHDADNSTYLIDSNGEMYNIRNGVKL